MVYINPIGESKMSVFDPQAFLDVQILDQNVKRPPINEGDYTATIGEVKTASGARDDGTPWLQMIVPLAIDVPPDQQSRLGQPTITLTDRVFIDLTAQGTMDNSVGKNRGQRLYRDATDTNKPGEPFSWRMLQGRMVKVRVKHEMYEGEIQERVSGVAKI
jgi:hypothetical protein